MRHERELHSHDEPGTFQTLLSSSLLELDHQLIEVIDEQSL
jgi:hypothetical protein